MAEETNTKPVKGQTFLRKFGKVLAGEKENPETDPETEAQRYEKKTRALEAQDAYLNTQDRIANPLSLREIQAKQMEEIQNRATEAEKRAREAEDKAREADAAARKEAEATAAEARKDAQAAKDALHDHQLQMMSAKLDEVLKSRMGAQQQFDEYFTFVDTLASKLGYQRPGLTTPASENPQIALEVVKLQLADAQKQREHEWQLEKDKREWDLKMEEIRETRAYNQAQLDLDRQKSSMLAQLPETLGGAILKGAMDRSGHPSRVTQTGQRPATQQKAYKVRLGVGEANEFECPHCKEAGVTSGISVGPTSVTARCLTCNSQFPIERVEPGPQPEQEE